MECPEAATGMVEDPIDHDPHRSCMSFVQQLAKGGFPAEQRIHLHVVEGVVTVIGCRTEDRIQIEGVDTQLCQVVEPVDDAQKISALKTARGRRRPPRLEADGRRMLHPGTAAESIREDLIEDRMLHPVRCRNAHRHPWQRLRPNSSPRLLHTHCTLSKHPPPGVHPRLLCVK